MRFPRFALVVIVFVASLPGFTAPSIAAEGGGKEGHGGDRLELDYKHSAEEMYDDWTSRRELPPPDLNPHRFIVAVQRATYYSREQVLDEQGRPEYSKVTQGPQGPQIHLSISRWPDLDRDPEAKRRTIVRDIRAVLKLLARERP